MSNNNFVTYLNTLHNVGANNENAIAEGSFLNEYQKFLNVERPVNSFLEHIVKNEDTGVFIITGHAGDGKTSLLFQVFNKLGVSFKPNKNQDVVQVHDKSLFYIKDFSEYSDEERYTKFEEAIERNKQGSQVIIIANTGPLLHTFNKFMKNQYGESQSEAESQFITLIDENHGELTSIQGHNFRVLNMAYNDNSLFVKPYLQKLINPEYYTVCTECSKKDKCPIFLNQRLISIYMHRIETFLKNHFIWQQEYGNRLTLRQIIAQLTYGITGGLYCKDIKDSFDYRKKYDYLFSNLVFGYTGVNENALAMNVEAIYTLYKSYYDHKKLIIDEMLFVHNDYRNYDQEVKSLIERNERHNMKNLSAWQSSMRRAYILFNNAIDEKEVEKLESDIFSHTFRRYLSLRNKEITRTADEQNLIREGLAILFTGVNYGYRDKIIVSLRKEGPLEQPVQVSLGELNRRDIEVILEERKNPFIQFENPQNQTNINILKLKVRGQILMTAISLPLLNYFYELRNGIISSSIDPQLTHGIDSIKAQIKRIIMSERNNDDDNHELILMGNDSWKNIMINFHDGKLIVEE